MQKRNLGHEVYQEHGGTCLSLDTSVPLLSTSLPVPPPHISQIHQHGLVIFRDQPIFGCLRIICHILTAFAWMDCLT